MKVTITTVYDRKTNPGIFSRLSHGLSFYIREGKEHILFDLGLMGSVLLKNMKKLNINPDSITKIILSHGHSDHAGGFNALLGSRTKQTKIPVFTHPEVRVPKRACFRGMKMWNAGVYDIKPDLEKRLDFKYSREPIQITPHLSTVGEIPLEERNEVQNLSGHFVRYEEGKWQFDHVPEELAVILKTKEEIALITACCHAGLVNTIRKAEELVNREVKTLIGALHLVLARKDKIFKVLDNIQNKTNLERLYLNHSIGERPFRILQKNLGEEMVQYNPVGRKLSFDC